jgi:nitrogen fixation NifU-like protein
MSIYSDFILDNYQSPKNFKEISDPDFKVAVTNSLCGDNLQFFTKIEHSKIKEIGFTGSGCAISIASASILTEFVKKKSLSEVIKISSKDVVSMLGIELTPIRLKCALLAWEGVIKVASEAKK